MGTNREPDLSFGNYDYIPLVTLTGTYPFGSPNVGQTSAISSIASASRTWETIEAVNVVLILPFAIKVDGEFDYFTK